MSLRSSFPPIFLCLFVQIFVQSFVANQKSKDKHWLQQSSKEADIEVDDSLAEELGARDAVDEEGQY
jgi:hypothetical protein